MVLVHDRCHFQGIKSGVECIFAVLHRILLDTLRPHPQDTVGKGRFRIAIAVAFTGSANKALDEFTIQDGCCGVVHCRFACIGKGSAIHWVLGGCIAARAEQIAFDGGKRQRQR